MVIEKFIPHGKILPRLISWFIAPLSVGGALLIEFTLESFVTRGTPLLLVFFAVMVSAWFGGFYSGLLALLFGFVGAYAFFLPPTNLFALKSINSYVQLLLFFLESVLVIILAQLRHRAQEQSIQREQELKTLIENAPDIISRFNEKLQYVYVNAQIKSSMGLSPQMIIGKTFSQIGVSKKLARLWQNSLLRVIKNGISEDIEYSYQTPDGTRYYQARLVPEFNRFGNVSQVLSVTRDITQQKLLEDRLQNAKQQTEAILQNIGDGVVVYDSVGRIHYANEAITKIFALPSTKFFKKVADITLWQNYLGEYFFMYDESGRPFKQTSFPPVRAIHAEKNPQSIIQFRNKKSKKERWLLIRSKPLYRPGGRISLIISIITDITKLKELEERKDEFVSIASHELKTPVTSLKLYADILRRYLQESNTKRATYTIGKIIDQIDNLKELVGDLLDMSRIQTGKLKLHTDRFNLDEVVEDIVEGLQGISRKHRLVFKKAAHLLVRADRFRIYQVITNLITNAVKYSPDGGDIIVSVKKEGKLAVVSVRDFGIGIDNEQQQRIFERLYQVSARSPQGTTGLGMGLYISHEIIIRHRGKIWVESEKGKGSTFSFGLPLLQ